MMDTLILGGGLAGASAALWLADLGRSATIVEARSRLGGRAHSRDWDGEIVEYGGGWLRRDHAEMQALCARLGLGLTPRAEVIAHSHFRDGRFQAAPAEDMAAHEAALAQVFAEAAAQPDDVAGLTLQAWFDKRALPASVRREILAWWSISGSADPTRVGVAELLTPKLAKGFGVKIDELAFTVTGGVSGLARAAAEASGAPVLMGDGVERVEDLGDHVQVTLASGRRLQGRTALVALPVNALNQVRFAPPLRPAQERLRQGGHLGDAIKLLIRARGPRPGHLATGETAGFRWLWADHLLADGSTLLVAFGLQAETGVPDAAAVARLVEAAFPGAEVTGFDWHAWATDPFARGTWVSPALDSFADYDPWGPLGRLAFAGSDLLSPEQGWFEGALLTARAAVAALDGRLQRED